MHKLIVLAIALLAALLLSLAACGDDDDSDEADATPTAAEKTEDGNGDDADDGEDGDDDEGDAPQGGTDLDSYFASMEDIATRTDEQLEAIGDELISGDFESEEEEIQATRDAFQQQGEILEAALLEMSELDPPEEAAEAHANFVVELQNVAAISSDLLADLQGITTVADAEVVIEGYGESLTAADETFDEACLELQTIADDNDIDRNLQCGDD